jgi:Ca2+-binding RTX toxin-like protein
MVMAIPGISRSNMTDSASEDIAANDSSIIDSLLLSAIDAPTQSLNAGFTTTLAGLDVSANMANLRLHVTDESATDGDSIAPTSFTGNFALDLLDPGSQGADNKLHLGELTPGADLLDATLSGNANVNLNLVTDLGTAVLPSIGADLNFAWGFGNAPVIAGDANTGFGNVPQVALKNIKLDLGSFFSDFATPVLNKVQVVTEPLQPVLDALTQPVPVLVDLADKADLGNMVPTLLDLMVRAGQVSEADAARLQLLNRIVDFMNSVPSDGGGAKIDLGDFSLGGQDPRAAVFQLANAMPTEVRHAVDAALQNPLLQDFLGDAAGLPGAGLAFPIIQNPQTAIGLLLGKDVDFVTYDAPDFGASGSINEFFPVAGPLGIRLEGDVSATAKLDFGYDSHGLADFAAGGFSDPGKIFDGFYVIDQAGPEAIFDADIKASLAVNMIFVEPGVGGGITGHAKINLEDPTPGDNKVRANEVVAGLSDGCLFDLSGKVTAGVNAYITVGWGPFSHTFNYDGPSTELVNFDGTSCGAGGHGSDQPVLARRVGADLALNIGPDAPLRMRGDNTDTGEFFKIEHVSGAAGGETVRVLAFSLAPQGYTLGPAGVIRGNGGALDDTLALAPEVLTPCTLGGGDGNDHLWGGVGADSLSGGAGMDFLGGRDGNDTLDGGTGHDRLDGGAGDDLLRGGAEHDFLIGGAGADPLDGGAGFDTASYVTAAGAVLLDLANPAASTEDALGDTFISIERFEGSDFDDTLRGDAGSNYLAGGKGNDRIEGRDGSDLLIGGAGADTLDGGAGADYVSYIDDKVAVTVSLATGAGSGGFAQGDLLIAIESLEGADTPGLPGDELEGSAFDNELRGLGGADLLRGLGGSDLLAGGVDNDRLDGGYGNDTLLGESGDDTLQGGAGLDTLNGGDGNDTLDGGGDADTLYGEAGADSLYGGVGNDSLLGGDGADNLDGGSGGDDLLSVGTLREPAQDPDRLDHLFGGTGFDTLSADFSNQTASIVWDSAAPTNLEFADGAYARNFEQLRYLATGAGNDAITQGGRVDNWFHLGTGDDTVNPGLGADNVDGGAGSDLAVLDFSVGDTAEMAGVQGGGNWDGGTYFRPLAANFSIRPDNIYLHGFERVRITGTGKNDSIAGTYGDDTLFGGDGNDTLDGVGGNNLLNGGNGDDVLKGSYGAGGTGANDTLYGGAGNDTLLPQTGSDTVFGGTGNDTITATDYSTGYGTDVLDGGEGDDVVADVNFNSGYTYTTAATRLKLAGGTGFDTLSADFGNQTQAINFTGGISNSVNFADGSYFRGFEALGSFTSGSGNDTFILPGRANNNLGGGDGIDSVYGGTGDDLLILDFSAGDNANVSGVAVVSSYWQRKDLGSQALIDNIWAAEFERYQITGGSKADFLSGGSFADVLIGKAGDDMLSGGVGIDRLDGGIGNDTLDAGAGADTMVGGSGNDTYLVDAVGDVVTELAAAGIDTVRTTLSSYSLAALSNVEHLAYVGSGAFTGTGNAGSNALTGGTGNDLLNGGAGNDTLNGGAGADTLVGGDGSDLYYVDNVGDSVSETNTALAIGGTDMVYTTISHTLGANIENLRLLATGSVNGAGNALNNILYAGAGNNILDGGAGIDTVSYAYAAAGITASLATTAAQATAGSGNDTLLGVENLTGGNYSDTLTGNGGNNVLVGGLGKDTLVGGLGADIFKFNTAAETNAAAALGDLIQDFNASQGDKINLSASDANSALAGDQAFTAPTQGGVFSGVFASQGSLYFDQTTHVLYGNNDADSAVDFAIQLAGISSLNLNAVVL